MKQFDNSLNQYYQLKKDLLLVAQKLNSCSIEEKEMYQDIVLCYSKHLKEMNKILQQKYGLNMCSYKE
ncbi:hypothetical protein BUN12_3628 [Bacillus amyloliquefaciens]|uniref:hypothetical protein n=1 Tax=Bacillus amyloliquefaciens TaxID=1390 RepID=UPI0007EF91FA|nr:hypothetical protein [Bacillus amyloliquefaciens]ARW37624.1 hypothetical protein S101267_00507 [Bacillus amyloliquefaciens]AZV91872.1 hypothetical protein BUN12_3628 [Bacillus amyloliquefaciens]MDR4375651.1 hypothetical protein [Bacillus amyloliquefaciens]MEC1841534.1 hypothetical protein [Bacillus amyloliquefaciens]MEC1849648.1 hypothetical protein [Bacillus amyloliquefaciens]